MTTPVNFSQDQDWMNELVLIAKNTYVWLHQLSNQYGRKITRLDQVPDEELALLASWGITGLWLIGLWERSPASRRIKQRMGQLDAVASAYSLYDYVIAKDLGGAEAAARLREKALAQGIRIASDMVPNHMGIDARWVTEHPDWFISVPRPPFPAYTFTGDDLSADPRAEIYLEDHYTDFSDAAVVFKHIHVDTGETRYIYHGNDGTGMPWNDTAQLNYLNAAMREAVIQTILDVARQFSIIRFDAAMALARQHIQRLWYPQKEDQGWIPSRERHTISPAQFDALLSDEFWREVVERVDREAPGTLLLAEAFWMLEGYFVRSLGMHRVYNSSFMHMLRDEENAKYRTLIKDTLAYDPHILKRYVNFMTNPDEDTALAQFGGDGRYLGVATLMATLPGTPMLGHGQVEGYAEKYGMEFIRPRLDEKPDEDMVALHEEKLAPLLKRRSLFADVSAFSFYDFRKWNGLVNENVFAFSNSSYGEHGLVLYHNQFAKTAGWIKTSVPTRSAGEQGELTQRRLAEALVLPNDKHAYVIFREVHDDLEYIRSCADIHKKGLRFRLGAYECSVYVDFRVVYASDEAPYGVLKKRLKGHGAHSIAAELQRLLHETARHD